MIQNPWAEWLIIMCTTEQLTVAMVSMSEHTLVVDHGSLGVDTLHHSQL